ncbi:MAG: YqeG family HAD IIIA-type phosphatase [Coriobacteriales bacterium]|jgi:HAD superfamily phosphatase (TIGR01668 family)|nr:YqeG family HAD IIIA-type phosphatase [Coriobacteriales bacterium]
MDMRMALFRPDLEYECVEDISVSELYARGFRAVLLDVDNTLIPRSTGQMPAAVTAWIERLKASGMPCCLLSNNWHKSVLTHAEDLGLPIVYKAMKPMPFAILRALGKTGVRRRDAVIIGDQLFTDILGARILGMATVLVQPRSAVDLWYTKLFRRIERRLRREPSD